MERVILTLYRILFSITTFYALTVKLIFLSKCLTIHQFIRVVEFLSENLNAKIPAAAAFLYVAKTFDKVWHESLIYKLIKLKFHLKLIHNIILPFRLQFLRQHKKKFFKVFSLF